MPGCPRCKQESAFRGRYCKPCNAEYQKEYRAKHPERVAAYKRKEYQKRKERILKEYGGVCSCCGEHRREFLSIDHVNGGGSVERAKGIRASRRNCQIVREGFPDTYRLLCHNCNQSLGQFGYCPHEREKSNNASST